MTHCRDGFTLLEIVIVLAILGLMLGLVVARGPMHSPRLDAESVAREFVGSLRLARSRAIAENRLVTVTQSEGGYQVDGLAEHSVPRNVVLTGNAVIRFAPDGSSSGGQIAVQTTTSSIAIVVDWLTGNARIVQAR